MRWSPRAWRIRHFEPVVFGLAIAAIVLPAASIAGEEPTEFERVQASLNVQPLPSTTEGISALFKLIQSGGPDAAITGPLIERLNHADYEEREAAVARFLRMPIIPRAALEQARDSKQLEIANRAAVILAAKKDHHDRLLFVALRTVETKQIRGVTEQLIELTPLCDESYMLTALQSALAATARKADAPALRKSAGSEHARVRTIAIRALGKVLGAGATADAAALLDDENDQVRFAATQVLAECSDRRALNGLVKLLTSEDISVRVGAALMLRTITGENFGYAGYDESASRDHALKKWQAWLTNDLKNAKLRFPADAESEEKNHLKGNLLLAFGGQGAVVEIDPAGNEVWRYQAKSAYCAEKLENGNVLITDYRAREVIEVDLQGDVVWRYETGTPYNAHKLANGNVLVCADSGSHVIEVNMDKKIVWEYDPPPGQGRCYDARRLPTGNTVIGLDSKLIEVAPTGKTVWEHEGKDGRVDSIQILPGGNILAAFQSTNRVQEITPSKRIVWEYGTGDDTISDAYRLANGNTLITAWPRFIEVTPDKRIVWSKQGNSGGSARK